MMMDILTTFTRGGLAVGSVMHMIEMMRGDDIALHLLHVVIGMMAFFLLGTMYHREEVLRMLHAGEDGFPLRTNNKTIDNKEEIE